MGTIHNITDYREDDTEYVAYVEVMFCEECNSDQWYVTTKSMICCGCHNEILFDELE